MGNGPVADERVLHDVLNATAALWRERHLACGRSDRRWAFRAALVTSAIERQRGLPQSPGQVFSPLLAVEEQGDGLVDAPLAGVGAFRGIDVVDMVPLHAVGELSEECSGALIGG